MNSSEIGLVEAILIAFSNDAISVHGERHVRFLLGRERICITVVIRVLKHLQHKSRLACIQVLGQPGGEITSIPIPRSRPEADMRRAPYVIVAAPMN